MQCNARHCIALHCNATQHNTICWEVQARVPYFVKEGETAYGVQAMELLIKEAEALVAAEKDLDNDR
eukprot:6194607-Lingulodinium_polyedra.AAC.1